MWEIKFNQHQPALQKRCSLLAGAPRCLQPQYCSSEELLDPPDGRSCHKPVSPVKGSRSQTGSTIKRRRRVTVILLWQFLESCRPGNLQVWRQMNQNRHCLEVRCKWRTNASLKKCFASSSVGRLASHQTCLAFVAEHSGRQSKDPFSASWTHWKCGSLDSRPPHFLLHVWVGWSHCRQKVISSEINDNPHLSTSESQALRNDAIVTIKSRDTWGVMSSEDRGVFNPQEINYSNSRSKKVLITLELCTVIPHRSSRWRLGADYSL